MKIAAIVPAAGKGKRLGSKMPKAFFPVLGKPLVVRTLLRLKGSFPFEEMIVAVAPQRMAQAKRLFQRFGLRSVRLVAGALTRAGSVKKALMAVSRDCDWVLVHDAARPFVSRKVIQRTIDGAKKTGAAICALPASATVKSVERRTGTILRTENRESLFLAQTPQVFKKDLLAERYRKLGARAAQATDEAALFDGCGMKVTVVAGQSRNIKITTPEDVKLLKFYLRKK